MAARFSRTRIRSIARPCTHGCGDDRVTDVNELPAAFADRVMATDRRLADELRLHPAE